MELHHLNAKSIHSAFLTACDAIITNREKLNSINLFPVADGDTGDNMSATALAVITHSATKPTLSETFQSLANAALMGAQGNSGMIFSQFFNGLTETPIGSEYIDTKTFAELITQASKSVRSAILHPVEGTIITVIDAWSKSAKKCAQEYACFKKLIKHTLTEVHLALNSTTDILPVLKKAQVVDAGALGFYHFINGFADYLINPKKVESIHTEIDCHETHHELPADGSMPEQRYCTEITLSGPTIDRVAIANRLETFGDSVVSSGNATLSRFHVHCTKPAEVFKSLFDEGTITHSKAQDMVRQFQMIHQRKHSIALVTDSSADLPQELLDNNQIHLLQLNMHLDGHNLIDRICVNQDTFYSDLAGLKTYPKTSFPSPTIIEEHIRHLTSHYDEVLILPIAQGLSGMYDAITKVSARFNNVHIINSCQASGGLGLLVTLAAQLIEQGLPIAAIKEALTAKIPKTNFYVYVKEFDSMIRSGRVSKISGRVAQFVRVKPIIKLDKNGKGVMFDKAFSETRALNKLIGFVDIQSLESYGIVHVGVPDKAHEFAERTTKAFGQPPAFIEYVSTALGLHAGHGAIALATISK